MGNLWILRPKLFRVFDLPIIRRRFTWAHPKGLSLSMFDRVLVSKEWMGTWLNPSVSFRRIAPLLRGIFLKIEVLTF